MRIDMNYNNKEISDDDFALFFLATMMILLLRDWLGVVVLYCDFVTTPAFLNRAVVSLYK